MSESDVLAAELRNLAQARVDLGAAETKLKAKTASFEKENQGLIDEIAELAAAKTRIDERCRQLALDAYVATGDRHPSEGVKIVMRSVTEYDDEAAVEFCIENKLGHLLKIGDKKKLRDVAAGLNLEFATTTKTPSANIDTDLSPLLVKGED